jgi:hypothetical protein
MAAKGPKNAPLKVSIRIEGYREARKAIRQLSPDAKRNLRAASLELSQFLAGQVKSAAMSDSAQSALMAPTVRAVRGIVPGVEVGGMAGVGRHGNPAYDVLFGAEFGATAYPQFRPHRGREGYFIFPTIEENDERIGQMWLAAVDETVAQFSGDGEG